MIALLFALFASRLLAIIEVIFVFLNFAYFKVKLFLALSGKFRYKKCTRE